MWILWNIGNIVEINLILQLNCGFEYVFKCFKDKHVNEINRIFCLNHVVDHLLIYVYYVLGSKL